MRYHGGPDRALRLALQARPAPRPRLSRAAAQTVTRAAKQAYICIDCGEGVGGQLAITEAPLCTAPPGAGARGVR